MQEVLDASDVNIAETFLILDVVYTPGKFPKQKRKLSGQH